MAVRGLLFNSNSVRILYYHRIDPAEDHISCLSPERFAAQMNYLAGKGYWVFPLDEIPVYLRQGTPFPPKSVVLTFDDGFKDNYTYAYPILANLRFRATIFLVGGYIGGQELPVLTRYKRRCLPLSWTEIEEMSKNRISFGAHSLTHPQLTRLAPTEVQREVLGSKKLIEDRLGKEVKFFCYPRGDFDDRVKAIVAKAGFSGACTIRPGATSLRSDLFALPRVYISRDDTLDDFRKKLNGAYDALHKGRQMWLTLKQRGIGKG
jgi:peptidoglycan/xylan/chitin deacetylase (PgdA/CDA1 family)